MTRNLRQLASLFFGTIAILLALPAAAWELTGSKTIKLQTRDGQTIVLGTVEATRPPSRYTLITPE